MELPMKRLFMVQTRLKSCNSISIKLFFVENNFSNKHSFQKSYLRKTELMHLMASMLELVDGTTGIKILGTSIGTVHNGVATVELVGIVQILQTLFGHFITRIGNPTVGLLEDGRTQVLVGMPPVGRTGGGAAGTENTLVQTIEEKTVFVGLEIFHFIVGVHGSLLLQPGLDGGVLFVEVGHI